MSYAGLGTIIMPPGSHAYEAYWNQRAQQCEMFGDPSLCLAQVARHVPVTIGSLGDTPTINWPSALLGAAVVGGAFVLMSKRGRGAMWQNGRRKRR